MGSHMKPLCVAQFSEKLQALSSSYRFPVSPILPTRTNKRTLDALEDMRHTMNMFHKHIWAMVNTHYMVDGHPIHNKDPYNGYYKSLWTIGWLAPINGY